MAKVQYLEDLMSDSDGEEKPDKQLKKARKHVKRFVDQVDLSDPTAVSLGALKRFIVAAGFEASWVQEKRMDLFEIAKPFIKEKRAAMAAKEAESSEESEDVEEEKVTEKESSSKLENESSAESEDESEEDEEKEKSESGSESEASESEEEPEDESEEEESEDEQAKNKKKNARQAEARAAVAEVDALLKEKVTPRKPLPTKPIKLAVEHTTSSKPSSPFILHFPNAPPPEATLRNQARGDSGDRMATAVHYCKDKRRAHHRVVLGETERMEYVASNFGSKNEDSDVTKFVVGVLDKKTMTMKLVESAHLFAMQQNIKEYKDTASHSALEGYEAQRELVNIFGGKKSKRNLGIAERYRVESTSQLESQLQSSISKTSLEVQLQTSIKETVEKRVRTDLPPYHLDAPDRANIYRLDEIVIEEHWELLEREGASLADMSASDLHALMKTNDYQHPACVLGHLPQLASKKGRAKKKLAAKLMYLTYLVYFFKYFKNNARGNIGQVAKMTGVPEGIVCQFLELFAQQEQDGDRVKYSMGRMLKMKLIHYILVVNLIIANFSMRLDYLCKDLLFDDKKISQHCTSIGCKVTRSRKRSRADTPKKGKKAVKRSEDDDASEVDDVPEDMGNFDVPPGTQVARLTHPLTFPELRVGRAKQ